MLHALQAHFLRERYRWCAPDSLRLQAETSHQQQEDSSVADVVTEDDFYRAAQSPLSGNHSEAELQELKGAVVGQPVREQWLSAEQLKQGGYSSWREYVACQLIRAW